MSKDKAGYLVAALLGAFSMFVVGYFATAAAGDQYGFHFWISHPVRLGGLWWAASGLFFGIGARFAFAPR